MSLSHTACTVFAALVAVGLTSCTASHVVAPVTVHVHLSGRSMGGEQPISNESIHLYQVGVGYTGAPATDLLTSPVTTSDGTGVGGDASNNNNQFAPGYFTITGDYPCPTTDNLVYLAAVGGNPGAGENDSQVNLLALGDCNTLQSTPFIVVNEVTTVGTVAALYSFMPDGGPNFDGINYANIGSTSGDPALAAAFTKVAGYINLANGSAPGPALPAGYDAAPNDLRALANAVQSCVNSVSSPSSPSSVCSDLFNAVSFNADYFPGDTVYALWNLFNDPHTNVSAIFNLQGPQPAFAPTNGVAPLDWTLPVLPLPGAPTFAPVAGTYSSTQPITISDSDANAVLYYTTDGSTPTASSSMYTGPIYLTSSGTIKAFGIESGRVAGSVGSAAYTINVVAAAAPTFSPTGGSYTSPQTVTISSTTPQAHYYYTTDGSTPTTSSTAYTAPITVSVSETLKAVAYAAGYGLSPVSSAIYAISTFTPNIITTVAGSGLQHYYGDGVYPTAAQFASPNGVIEDASGNLYIADSNNSVIRKISASSGIITTIAGNGNPGFSGDGGLATSALLSGPTDMFFDTAGNLYFTDNDRVRRIDHSTSIITTVVGGGGAGGSTGTAGLDPNGDGGPALSANVKFQGTRGVLVDANGNIYVSDFSNFRIRMVYNGGSVATAFLALQRITSPVVGNIYTICGDFIRTYHRYLADGTTLDPNPYAHSYSGDGGLAVDADVYSPGSMAFDPSGNLVFADVGNSRIRKIDFSTGNISTIAGGAFPDPSTNNPPQNAYGYAGDGGSATDSSVRFTEPEGVTYDASGNLFITDSGNNVIRKVAAGTGILTSLAGSIYGNQGFRGDGGPARSGDATRLYSPRSVAVDPSGAFYIADTFNSRIRLVDTSGNISTFAGSGAANYTAGLGGNALQAEMYFPEGVAVDSSNNLYIADSALNQILKVTASTGYLTRIAGTGASGNGGNGTATSIALNMPHGLAVDTSGNVYIADSDNSVIRKVDTSGNSTVVAGQRNTIGYSGDGGLATSALLGVTVGIALDPAGNLYIADSSNQCIRKVSASNQFISTVVGNCGYTGNTPSFGGDGGSATAAAAKLSYCDGVTVSASDDIYIADTNNKRIRLVYNGGAAAASLLIAQGQTPVVGNIYTIAGNGTLGSTGDGNLGNNSATEIGFPMGVTLDSSGNVFFATQSISSGFNGNERIRRIDAVTGKITTYVNSTGIGDNNSQTLSGAQIGDGGAASNAMLTSPAGVAFDSQGNLYIGDSYDRRVRMVAH